MLRSGNGSVIFISSTAHMRNDRGRFAYASTKAAISSTTKTLARELGLKKIRVNAICPGWVDTPFIRKQEEAGRDLSPITNMTPMGRMARPDEIANAAEFLLSDASSAVTGSALVVDCGITLAGGYLPYGDLPS